MKKAFTMLELIFVIVIMGVLTAYIVPNTQRNPLQEAAVQIASHLRYTQHLAMTDDRYNPNRRDTANDVIWFKDRWQLVFSSSEFTGGEDVWAYTIFSDRVGNEVNRGDADFDEVARNPENSSQLMTGGYSNDTEMNYTHDDFIGMKTMNIGKKYGIVGDNAVDFSNSCDGRVNNSLRISFDHLGRPFQGRQSSMSGPYSPSTHRLITQTCTITISDGSDSVEINIEPETGYVHLNFDT